MQLLSIYVLVHNSFEYFNLQDAIGESCSIGVSVVLRPRLLVDIPCLAGSCGRPPLVSRMGRVYRPMDKHPLWCILIRWFVPDLDIPL